MNYDPLTVYFLGVLLGCIGTVAVLVGAAFEVDRRRHRPTASPWDPVDEGGPLIVAGVVALIIATVIISVVQVR